MHFFNIPPHVNDPKYSAPVPKIVVPLMVYVPLSMMHLLTTIYLFFLTGYHPVHFSVMNIDHQKDKGILSLTFKVFPDDLRMVAFHRYGDRIDSTAVKDTANSEKFVERYLRSMVVMVVNKTDTLKMDRIEKKTDDENIWFYSTIPVKGEIKEFHIANYLMMDIFGDQTNLVIVQINGKEKGVSLDAWKPDADLDFSESQNTN